MKYRLLAPLSWIYGLVTDVRNLLFDWNVLPSESFDLPVIGIGNLTAGGTGKTPHTEYLIRLLKDDYRVAFLSRGYRRKSKGNVLARADSTAEEIGDEPRQVWQHHPDIHVAVDASRREGIRRLMGDEETADTQVVLLDDAYQHRHVRPGLNILLCDSQRMPYDDRLLPAGLLRESFNGRYRADIIIVTKCRDDMQPIDYRVFLNHLAPRANQQVFFTTYDYGHPLPLSQWKGLPATKPEPRPLSADTHVVLLTGIAQPQPLIQYLQEKTQQVIPLTFPDHHAFSQEEIRKVCGEFNRLSCPDKRLILTEKDAARLPDELLSLLPAETFVLPVTVRFLQDGQEMFNHTIKNYVRENSRNSSVHP